MFNLCVGLCDPNIGHIFCRDFPALVSGTRLPALPPSHRHCMIVACVDVVSVTVMAASFTMMAIVYIPVTGTRLPPLPASHRWRVQAKFYLVEWEVRIQTPVPGHHGNKPSYCDTAIHIRYAHNCRHIWVALGRMRSTKLTVSVSHIYWEEICPLLFS